MWYWLGPSIYLVGGVAALRYFVRQDVATYKTVEEESLRFCVIAAVVWPLVFSVLLLSKLERPMKYFVYGKGGRAGLRKRLHYDDYLEKLEQDTLEL